MIVVVSGNGGGVFIHRIVLTGALGQCQLRPKIREQQSEGSGVIAIPEELIGQLDLFVEQGKRLGVPMSCGQLLNLAYSGGQAKRAEEAFPSKGMDGEVV